MIEPSDNKKRNRAILDLPLNLFGDVVNTFNNMQPWLLYDSKTYLLYVELDRQLSHFTLFKGVIGAAVLTPVSYERCRQCLLNNSV